jgi:hypothetical protein
MYQKSLKTGRMKRFKAEYSNLNAQIDMPETENTTIHSVPLKHHNSAPLSRVHRMVELAIDLFAD